MHTASLSTLPNGWRRPSTMAVISNKTFHLLLNNSRNLHLKKGTEREGERRGAQANRIIVNYPAKLFMLSARQSTQQFSPTEILWLRSMKLSCCSSVIVVFSSLFLSWRCWIQCPKEGAAAWLFKAILACHRAIASSFSPLSVITVVAVSARILSC